MEVITTFMNTGMQTIAGMGGLRCSNAQRTSNRTANASASHWSRPPRPPHKPLSLPNSPVPATLPKHTPAYAQHNGRESGLHNYLNFEKSAVNNFEKES
jgi:hypothetical protein